MVSAQISYLEFAGLDLILLVTPSVVLDFVKKGDEMSPVNALS